MFKKLAITALLATTILSAGCATHLSPGQAREYSALTEKGLAQKEKSVPLAATLGLFPVIGYAYIGEPWLAITSPVTYLFLGPLWMPVDVAMGAKNANYFSTKENAERQKRIALREIDHKLEEKQLSYEQHLREQREIEAKYSPY